MSPWMVILVSRFGLVIIISRISIVVATTYIFGFHCYIRLEYHGGIKYEIQYLKLMDECFRKRQSLYSALCIN